MASTIRPVDDSPLSGEPRRILDAITGALADGHELSLLGLPPDELEAFTIGVLRATESMQALTASAVHACEQRGINRRHGRVSITSFLASRTGGCSKAIGPARMLGRWVEPFAEFAAAWAAGVLSQAHVRELRKLDNPRTHRLLAPDQGLLIEQAQGLEFKDWLSVLGYWVLHADPDGSVPDPSELRPGITVCPNKNGMSRVTIDLDPLLLEPFLTMLDHEAQKLFRAAKDNPDLPRLTDRERRLTALMRLMARGFQRADGTFPAPLFNFVMSQKVAEDLIRRMTGDPTDGSFDPHTLPVAWDDIDARCETVRGTPIDPRRLWPALLVGRLRRQILNAEGRTIDVGHDVRLFPPALKNALLVESRGHCRTPGCNAPFAWLVADHAVRSAH